MERRDRMGEIAWEQRRAALALRAAHTTQLGAALAIAPEQGAPLALICLDERLHEAAEREELAPSP